jgi:flagellar hook-associated protein 1 FlgK
MGLNGLDAALSGLRVAQQQISVISNNVSNVGTPGYSRKILPQSSQAIEGVTMGVIGGTVIRNVNLNLERDLWTQVSSVGYLDVQQSYLSRIQQFHGDPSKNLSVAAELSALMDTFSALADSPEDAFLQTNTVNKAVSVANKVNNLSKLITEQRNDVQDEMKRTVERINELLGQVASINLDIKGNTSLGRTTAVLEDKRDDAVKELTGLMDISFFRRGDNVLVIQTVEGVELASTTTKPLTFRPQPIGPASYYPAPGTAAGVYVGDPVTDIVTAVDITAEDVGGKLGGLIQLRDQTFPKQMAQVDELAHKMALRFDAQGLRLFTDASGSIPLDTAPDPTTLPNPTSVTYVGFSSVMRVNANVLSDHSLIQEGTYGAALPVGSNEVIRRVIQNTFGIVNYQEAANTDATNLTQIDLLNTGGADLQTWLGLFSSNTLASGRDLSAYLDAASFILAANGDLGPTSDTFTINFAETRSGITPPGIDISLSAVPHVGTDFADDLAQYINGQIAFLYSPAEQAALAASASVNANGQVVLTTRGSIEIDAGTPANPMGQTGLNYLGFSDNAGSPIAPTDPYFDVGIGNNPPTRITIEPNDFAADLITKLDAVPGLAIDLTAFGVGGDGILRMRPGDDYDNPDFGGDMTLTSGPFTTGAAAYGSPPATTLRAALDAGVNVISALFGTYSIAGTIVTNGPAVQDYGYQSEEDASALAPSYLAFRESLLGPSTGLDSNIVGATTLADYAQKMVNEQSQEIIGVQARLTDEKALQTVIEQQFLDESGVNLDEELGHLITVQTAYSAAARVVSAVDELFQDLLNAVR